MLSLSFRRSLVRRRSLAALTAALVLPLAGATPAVAQEDPPGAPDRPAAEPDRPRPPRGDRGDRPDGDRPRGERPDGPPPERRGPGGPRGPEQMGRFLQMMPVMAALDADGDGTLSAAEIQNASVALKTVDKNGDGQIDGDEMRPNFEGRRPGGPGGEGRPGPGRPGMDRPDGDRRPPRGLDNILKERDKNGDGVLSDDEIPERMQKGMKRIDTNGDGKVDRAELEKLAEQMRSRRGDGDRPRGERPDGERPRGDRPDGDRPRGERDGDDPV